MALHNASAGGVLEYDAALRDIDRALAIEPRHFGALCGRGMVLEKQGDMARAIEAYKDALAVHPWISTTSSHLHVRSSTDE